MARRARIAKWVLATYFGFFLIFLYGPMLLMAVLSFQGKLGVITWPFRGPISGRWWSELIRNPNMFEGHADEIRTAGITSIEISLAAGVVVALIAFTLSVAFRRRFKGDSIAFYLIMLALMTPGFLLSVGTSFFWKAMGFLPSLWKTGLGTNSTWGIPFGFLVMLAIWNRYDMHIEEAARDLGADARTTFREVTLPLVWTGIFGAFLFGFTLTWNDYDHTVLVIGNGENTLPVEIFALTFGSSIRPDLYALGTATTLVTLLAIGIVLVIATIRARLRGPSVPPTDESEIEMTLQPDTGAGPGGAAPARAR